MFLGVLGFLDCLEDLGHPEHPGFPGDPEVLERLDYLELLEFLGSYLRHLVNLAFPVFLVKQFSKQLFHHHLSKEYRLDFHQIHPYHILFRLT